MAAPGGAGHLGDLAVADPVPRVVQEAVVPLHRGHAEVGPLHRAVLRDMSPPRTVLTLLPARRLYTGAVVARGYLLFSFFAGSEKSGRCNNE